MTQTEMIYFACFVIAMCMVLWLATCLHSKNQELDVERGINKNLQRKKDQAYEQLGRVKGETERLQSLLKRAYDTDRARTISIVPKRPNQELQEARKAPPKTPTVPHIFGLGYPPAYVPPEMQFEAPQSERPKVPDGSFVNLEDPEIASKITEQIRQMNENMRAVDSASAPAPSYSAPSSDSGSSYSSSCSSSSDSGSCGGGD